MMEKQRNLQTEPWIAIEQCPIGQSVALRIEQPGRFVSIKFIERPI